MGTRNEAVQAIQAAFADIEGLVEHFSGFAESVTGLTGPQLLALKAIAAGATKVGDVARATLTHVSTASRAVDQLVGLGLVTRTEDPEDRRAVVLGSTAAGAEVFGRLQARGSQVLDAGLHDWTVADLEALAALLRRFRAGMGVAFVDAAAARDA